MEENHAEENKLEGNEPHRADVQPPVEPESTPPVVPEPVVPEPVVPEPVEETPPPPAPDAAPIPPEKPDVVKLDPTVKKPSFLKRAFSNENKFGRFMRLLGKAILITLVLLLTGLILGYFLFYQPLDRKYKTLQTDHQVLQTEVADLKTLVVEKDEITTKLQKQVNDLEQDAGLQTLHTQFLALKNQVTQARFLAANKDKAGALTAVKDAQQMVKAITPDLQKYLGAQEDVMEVTDRRLGLIATEINSDLPAALNDLEKVYSRLLELEGTLFK